MVTYKTERLRKEFDCLTHWLIRMVVYDLTFWCRKIFGKPVKLTCVGRTPVENEADRGIKYSAHNMIDPDSGAPREITAVDIRSWIYTQEEIDEICAYLVNRWGDLVHVKYHDTGAGPHIHINVVRKYVR